ncbi:MAG: DNA-processing protein DprA [Egibacteraceae bacterium]
MSATRPTARLRRDALALAAAGIEGEAVSRACREAGPRATPEEVAARLLRTAVGDPGAVAEVEHRLAALGARVAVVGEDAYPRRLAASWPELGAPLWLFVAAGGARLPSAPAVAIVGTRRPSLDGLAVARELAAAAAQAGAVVVSGLARGVDEAAHEGALAAGGATVGVLGSGLGVDYPRGSAALRARVAEAGGLVTEYVPGTPPRPHRVLQRNRIIAGLVDVVVLVEGGARSGALTTARLALEQGREVLACPAALPSPHAAAPLALIRDGARVVTAPDDVVDALGLLRLGERAAAPRGGEAAAHDLSGLAGQLWALLSATPRSVDALAAATGRPASAVLAAVVELAAAGLAARGARGIVRVPQ